MFDTSVAVAFRDGATHVIDRAEWLESVALLSVLSVVELEAGVVKDPAGGAKRRAALDSMYEILDILPFGMTQGRRYSRIIAAIGFSRPRIIDRMIAAQALVAGASVATLNPRDFRSIPGLDIQDWTVATPP